MKRICFGVFGLLILLPFSVLAASKAGIVIQNSTGEVITRCVEFEESQITVDELLIRSGFELVTEKKSWGTSVKFIHDDGVHAGETDPRGWFWNFYQNNGSNWVMSDTGVSSTQAKEGTIFCFVYGAWDAVKPPQKNFADVCELVSHAGLVIDHSDGRRLVQIVSFNGETITGYQLLQKSGLNLVSHESSWGLGICSINGEGMAANSCFDDPQGRYWAFNVLGTDNSWISSPVGVSKAIVYDQDVHGYYYSTWGMVQAAITHNEVFGLPSSVSGWNALR